MPVELVILAIRLFVCALVFVGVYCSVGVIMQVDSNRDRNIFWTAVIGLGLAVMNMLYGWLDIYLALLVELFFESLVIITAVAGLLLSYRRNRNNVQKAINEAVREARPRRVISLKSYSDLPNGGESGAFWVPFRDSEPEIGERVVIVWPDMPPYVVVYGEIANVTETDFKVRLIRV